jgi:hypothetical protein
MENISKKRNIGGRFCRVPSVAQRPQTRRRCGRRSEHGAPLSDKLGGHILFFSLCV